MEDLFWHAVPKTIDDALYTALMAKGMTGFDTPWDMHGLEGSTPALEFTIGRNNIPSSGFTLVGYAFNGNPGSVGYGFPDDREAAFIYNQLKDPEGVDDMPPYGKAMVEGLQAKGLIKVVDGFVKPTFPVYCLPGLDTLDGCYTGYQGPEFIERAKELGPLIRDLWFKGIIPAINGLIDEYHRVIGNPTPDDLQPMVGKAVWSTIFQLREHVWDRAVREGYIARTVEGHDKPLGLCLYVTA